MPSKKVVTVDYAALDKAKNAFIVASRKTLGFAKRYGFLPSGALGASANVFSLDLKPFLENGAKQLFVTLLPEGLGTADDARPNDLNERELVRFWHNIGIKTVAVMTNDAAATGMQTILISLYLPSSEPEKVFDKAFMEGFLKGFVEGCRQVGCVYFSGETPQLKNKIFPGKLDIAGALFGIMPPKQTPISSERLKAGDHIVFVESSGPHENGFTTLRKLAENLPHGYHTKLPSGKEYFEALNAPSVLYTSLIQDILKAGIVPTNIEPISGHGWQKLMRAKKSFSYVIEKMLPVPEIFSFVQMQTGMTAEQMVKIFNYGVGYAIFTSSEKDANAVVRLAHKQKLKAVVAGKVHASKKREVIIKPLNVVLSGESFTLKK